MFDAGKFPCLIYNMMQPTFVEGRHLPLGVGRLCSSHCPLCYSIILKIISLLFFLKYLVSYYKLLFSISYKVHNKSIVSAMICSAMNSQLSYSWKGHFWKGQEKSCPLDNLQQIFNIINHGQYIIY